MWILNKCYTVFNRSWFHTSSVVLTAKNIVIKKTWLHYETTYTVRV